MSWYRCLWVFVYRIIKFWKRKVRFLTSWSRTASIFSSVEKCYHLVGLLYHWYISRQCTKSKFMILVLKGEGSALWCVPKECFSATTLFNPILCVPLQVWRKEASWWEEAMSSTSWWFTRHWTNYRQVCSLMLIKVLATDATLQVCIWKF